MRKKERVNPAVGIRFDAAIGEAERLATEALCRSALATLASWETHAETGHVFATVEPPACDAANLDRRLLASFEALGATLSLPPAVVLDVRPHDPARRAGLVAALARDGRPAGVASTPFREGLLVEIDETRTPLALAVALIDAVTGPLARTIRSLRPLSDATLAAFAAARLADPELSERRVIEWWTRPLAAEASAR